MICDAMLLYGNHSDFDFVDCFHIKIQTKTSRERYEMRKNEDV